MREISGNVWDYQKNAIVAVTTNGQVTKSGKAVMGRGVPPRRRGFFPGFP